MKWQLFRLLTRNYSTVQSTFYESWLCHRVNLSWKILPRSRIPVVLGNSTPRKALCNASTTRLCKSKNRKGKSRDAEKRTTPLSSYPRTTRLLSPLSVQNLPPQLLRRGGHSLRVFYRPFQRDRTMRRRTTDDVIFVYICRVYFCIKDAIEYSFASV